MKTTSKQRGRVTGRGFLPGRSGNAGGRPKSATKLIETIQQETRDGKELVEFMLLTFRSGPMRYRIEAAHWLTERGFGKAPQIVEHMGEDGGPVSVKVIRGEGAPDRTRDAAGRDSRGRFRSGVSGNPARRFQPGTSGNPSGKPKNFSIHQLMAEAIDDNTRDEAVGACRRT